jgi:vancomycin resistance protein YoaR
LAGENTPNWNAADSRRRSPEALAMTSLGGAVEWPNEAERPAAPARRVRRRSPRGPVRFILLALLALVALFLAGASGGLYYLDRAFDGKIYPNITVRGLPIGEMTPEQALAALDQRYAPFLEQPVGITFGDKVWRPTLAELGARLELREAVDSAFAAGRRADTVTNLWQVAAIWQRGIELPLHLSLDQAAMQRYLTARAAEIDQPARDAQLVFDGVTASTIPSRDGRQLLFEETMHDLSAALQTLEPQQVALRTREQRPLLHDAEALAAQQKIESMLLNPIAISAENKQYELSVDDISRMILITRVPGATSDQIAISIDHTLIKRRLWTIAEETGIGSVNPRVDWNGGNLKIIRPGEPGKRIDAAASEIILANAVMGGQASVTLPFKQVNPIADESSLRLLGINELVSVGRSDFTGSADYRITNIKAGMRLLHGVLIAPGEEFSFNDTVGEIDAANGFVEGKAIVQNRTVDEFGGGICQDSTTVFRAAFWAGLPITERKEHSFYINWYDKYGLGDRDGPGLDAAIFTGAQDFQFLNDTGNWLLMQTYVDERRALAEVRLYGTKLDRVVSLTARRYDEKAKPPQPRYLPDSAIPRGTHKQSDKGRGGFTVDVYRTIVENGVKRSPQLFRTRFQPWPDIYLYNPADLGPNGRPLPRPEPPPVDPSQQPPVDPSQPPVDPSQPPVDPNQQLPVDPNQQPAPPVDPGQPPLVEQPAQPPA